MKLHELRSVRAVADSGFRITAAAEAIHGSQPGISRHVQHVEQELGVELFERRRNRLVGLTAAGRALLPIIEHALDQIDGLPQAAAGYAAGELGSLTVATSHTHARYLLPPIIEAFIQKYPAVRLTLRQGYGEQVAAWLHSGEADISISTEPPRHAPSLSFHPIGEIHRVVLAPPGHPLLRRRKPSLADLAAYPIITYSPEYAAYAQIMKTFESRGLFPTIALGTSDTDTIKTYAMCGLGIAILADSAFEPQRDDGLRAIDVRHLFPSSPITVGLNRERPLSPHASRLMELLELDLAPRRGSRSARP